MTDTPHISAINANLGTVRAGLLRDDDARARMHRARCGRYRKAVYSTRTETLPDGSKRIAEIFTDLMDADGNGIRVYWAEVVSAPGEPLRTVILIDRRDEFSEVPGAQTPLLDDGSPSTSAPVPPRSPQAAPDASSAATRKP